MFVQFIMLIGITVGKSPLDGLPRLPKPHYSWPAEGLNWTSALADQEQAALLHDYARVTGSLPVSINDPASGVGSPATTIEDLYAIAELCLATNATIAINYSPWYAKFSSDDPSVEGPEELAEVTYFESGLDRVATVLAHVNAATTATRVGKASLPSSPSPSPSSSAVVGAIILDSEKFSISPDSPPGYATGLTRKNNLAYNATQRYFPKSTIIQYGRGAVARWPWGINKEAAVSDPWVKVEYYSPKDLGTSFSVALYTVPEPGYMRETFNRTAANALAIGAAGSPAAAEVVPFVALGTGQRRAVDLEGGMSADFAPWNYSYVYSYMLGAEINQDFYGTLPGSFALWNMAHNVVLFPSPLKPDLQSVSIEHLREYVKGSMLGAGSAAGAAGAAGAGDAGDAGDAGGAAAAGVLAGVNTDDVLTTRDGMHSSNLETSVVLEVDFAQPIGVDAIHRGSGILHTVFSPCGACPYANTDAQIAPLKINSYRGREAFTAYERLAGLGVQNIQLVVSDWYGYYCSNTSGTCASGQWPPFTPYGLANPGICCFWPGENGNWSRLDQAIEWMSEKAQSIERPDLPAFQWDIWNEIDSWGGFWEGGGESVFFAMWKRSVTAIRKLNPRAKIVGPSFARSYNCDSPRGPCGPTGPNGTWDGTGCFGAPPLGLADKICGLSPLGNTTMKRFLEFGLANDVLPDILSWHEWSPQLSFLPDHVKDVVTYLKANPDVASVVKAISINEAQLPDDYLKTGVQVAVYAAVEAANVVAGELGMPVDVIKTNYGWGTLDGAILDINTAKKWGVPPATPRGLWYVGEAYGNLTGPLFQVSQPTPVKGVAALASYDDSSRVARVLVGSYANPADPPPLLPPPPVHLMIKNLPANVLIDGTVAVTLVHIQDAEVVPARCTSGVGPACFPVTPTIIYSVVTPSSSGGVLEFDLPTTTNSSAGWCNADWSTAGIDVISTPCSDAWSLEFRPV